jgi:hypothetical protein
MYQDFWNKPKAVIRGKFRGWSYIPMIEILLTLVLIHNTGSGEEGEREEFK